MDYVSEHGQDRYLAEQIFPDMTGGTFLEIGALDGLLHSNTLWLERERGWRGGLAEANPAMWGDLIANRPTCLLFRNAVWDESLAALPILTITGTYRGWSGATSSMDRQHLSRIGANVRPTEYSRTAVPAITLEQACRQTLLCFDRPRIDYLSIDVEGAEERILSTFPFSDFDIDVIGCEDNWGNPALAAIFTRAEYEKIGRVGNDDFWRRPWGNRYFPLI